MTDQNIYVDLLFFVFISDLRTVRTYPYFEGPRDKTKRYVQDLKFLATSFAHYPVPTLTRDVGIPSIKDLQSRTHY